MSPKVTRREFIESAVASTVVTTTVGPVQSATRPNVLFILADDLGYGDLSCYGRPDYERPCSIGSRAGPEVHEQLFGGAGLHADALRVHHGSLSAAVARGARGAARSSRPERRIAAGPSDDRDAARGDGYETSLIGKWHLGWKPEFNPNRHGFDEFFGALSGAVDYFTHARPTAGGMRRGRICGRT